MPAATAGAPHEGGAADAGVPTSVAGAKRAADGGSPPATPGKRQRAAGADGGDAPAAEVGGATAGLPPLPAPPPEGLARELLQGMEALLKSQRLCLVLDLDHTLVNSAKFGEIEPDVEYILQDMLAQQVSRGLIRRREPLPGGSGQGAAA
jgi:hypothetical protein